MIQTFANCKKNLRFVLPYGVLDKAVEQYYGEYAKAPEIPQIEPSLCANGKLVIGNTAV